MKDNKTKIYYWCPFINKVATVKAVYNSVTSINKFSDGKFESIILDAFGEWENNRYFEFEKISIHKLNNSSFIKKIPSLGFFFSRLKYLFIFFSTFFPLKKFLKKIKPKFLIIHLMTSLPLFLNLIYSFDTKIILRISGKPKLNIVRHIFWKIALKKIFKITFPTKETLKYFKNLNLVEDEKLFLLYDPIISTKEINIHKKKEKINDLKFKNYYLSIGRLTRQKNFSFLINCFNELIKRNNKVNLVIIGEGEELKTLKNLINKYKIENNILLLGYRSNVFKYLNHCEGFILSSLWEDPGFVLIEAMYCNTLVLSSDCQSGPKEILEKNRGFLFKNNSKHDFIKQFETLKKLNNEEKYEIKYNAKKFTKEFSLLNHYKNMLILVS